MVGKQELREVGEAAGAIGGLLTEAVAATVADRSPDAARACVGEFLDIDAHAASESESGPAQLLATLTLVRRLGLVRAALADRPDRVEEVLAWVEETLGRRYRSRCRYTSGALRDDTAASEITMYRPALQDDFLSTLIWLLAGAVAVHGAGEIGWLEALEADGPA